MKFLLISLLVLILCVLLYYWWPSKTIPEGTVIDKLVVLKADRKLLVYSGEKLIKAYTISLGENPIGHKEFEGDNKTPEGVYTINDRNPNSAYFLNLGVSYPNQKDRDHAKSLGKSPGGDIKIHGLRNDRGFIGKFHRFTDWTAGCIAVTNHEMQELYDHVKIGAVIEIRK